MDDEHEFFDILYQQWSKTTGADDTYWMPEVLTGMYDITSVNPETQARRTVATCLTEEDADFIAGIHGAVPDLIRRLHEAIDDAERANVDRELA